MTTGKLFEDTAARHLEAAGLSVLDRNFSCKSGELDLICRDGDTVVFVEVRSRRASGFANALDSVDTRKQQKLIRTAQVYLQRKGWSDRHPCRFDVVAFDTGPAGREHHVQWLRDAFQT